MKNLIFVLLTFLSLSVFAGHKQVGAVNMISNRNIDSKTDYVLLKTGTDISNDFIRKNKASTLDQAINNTVAEVPGGEFMKNVKIYMDGDIFIVNGDVWGIATEANFEGFKIGDKIFIKNSLLKSVKEKFTPGVIIGFKDRKSCLVKTNAGAVKEVNYADISKGEN